MKISLGIHTICVIKDLFMRKLISCRRLGQEQLNADICGLRTPHPDIHVSKTCTLTPAPPSCVIYGEKNNVMGLLGILDLVLR